MNETKFDLIPFKEAWQMVLDKEIKDSCAVISLLRVYYYLKKQNRIDF
jgi:hypothetical protein